MGRFGMVKQDLSMPDEAVTPEYLLDNHWIVGDPETVAQKIRALSDLVGGFGKLLVIAHEWPDPAVWDRSMTLLANEVMPKLADLGAPAMATA
jgi:alkanesulfonate monooxygenase SsuD/methylene tetrahydromethanopterin reductase-like flavin-dependent oxidoreductase (luciferase family)